MYVLSWISFYAPLVIIILAVVAVLLSFFWVFLPAADSILALARAAAVRR